MRPRDKRIHDRSFGKGEAGGLRFRTPYYLPHEDFTSVGLAPGPEEQERRTKQSFVAECDINNLLKRYETTGQLPDMIKVDPRYGDFADAQSYQESVNIVMHAQAQFDALSAHIRSRFQNDPVKFLEFTQDPRNAEEMATMGLMTPDAVKRVQDAKIAALKQGATPAQEEKPKAHPKHKKDEGTES